MDKETIDSFSFARFAEEFSIKVPGTEDSPQRFRFGRVPGVTDFRSMVSRIDAAMLPELYFMGVIGSVDKVFSYIANLNPRKSFLFDSNEHRVLYLGLRTAILKHSKKVSDSYFRMIQADQAIQKELLKMEEYERKGFINLIDLDGDAIEKHGRKLLRELGFEHPSGYVSRLFTGRPDDPGFGLRRHFANETLESIARAEQKLGSDMAWTEKRKFSMMWQYAVSNRIRGFRADLSDGFSDTAKMIIDAYGIKNLAVYISNIGEEGEYASGPKHIDDMLGDLPGSLDNLIVLSERERTGPHFNIWVPYRNG